MEELTDQNFEENIKKRSPIIVDFWASWCGPCRMMGPVFEDLSKEYEGKLAFAKVNTDNSPATAQMNSIMSIPCLIMFKGGKESARIIGAMPKEMLKKKIDAAL